MRPPSPPPPPPPTSRIRDEADELSSADAASPLHCQVDESDRRENGHVKATTNNVDGIAKGMKDSATGKVELPSSAPAINIPVLSLDELKEKTDDFGSTALIGEGSYGRVYYAVLDNGTKLAVKKLDCNENEPTTEFLTQVSLVSRLKHENFIDMLGYCTECDMRIVAYEFATMGSLHDVLHGRLVTPRLTEDKVKQCVDPRLGEYPPKGVAKLAAVAALCVQYEAEFRPNMSIVVKALSPLLVNKQTPVPAQPPPPEL
ncbi:hypothetical protein EJB05_18083 [Eragrostis curvula]|uniref:Protein kinase domain-containing protein n=1 Tax=Eragrostis curvula TaxID=38414 RepID=A0A5J9VL32_9POAL|nr:hypothetical protein EJB05_18083 [Eragrostis curvula]